MEKKIRVLAINPGSTHTKIALYDDYDEMFRKTIDYSADELAEFDEFQDQLAYRTQTVQKAVEDEGFEMQGVDVFCSRGGGLQPMAAGVFRISELLAEHASKGMTGHPAQLAPQIAKHFADRYQKQAFAVNTPDVDELCDSARITGLKGMYRISHIHTLNQKEIARRFCESRGIKYEQTNLIICHMGGGVSITAHEKGRMIDSNDIINGSGPMTPTRAGDLPYIQVIDMAYSGEYTKKELVSKLNQDGGLFDHFGSTDIRDVLKMIANGDKYAEIVIDAMAYQCAKYAGAMAVALRGNVRAIILTGGMSNNEYFTGKIKERIEWIAETVVMPGEYELEALAAGAIRVMRGEEELKEYTGVPVWNGFF